MCGPRATRSINGIPDIIYVPEDARFELRQQRVSWSREGQTQTIKLMPDKLYVRPSGYKIRNGETRRQSSWRMVGTQADAILCHKPCTVSGGGKSEISKAISDAVLTGPLFVADFKRI